MNTINEPREMSLLPYPVIYISFTESPETHISLSMCCDVLHHPVIYCWYIHLFSFFQIQLNP